MGEIGAIASIIGVAGAGFRLSLILNAVSCEVSNAGLEVHSISKSVTLFAMMLKQTGNVLQSADSVHSPEAVETARSISEQSTKVFDEINDMLDRLRTKQVGANGAYTPTVEQRFRSCFKRHRVTYLLAQLENLKLSLSVMLQVIQLGKLMASTSKHDPPEEVAIKTEAILQERAEAQNGIIVRHWQMSQLDALYENFRIEEESDKKGAIDNGEIRDDDDDDLTLVGTSSSQLSIEGAHAETPLSNALVKLPIYTLGELDQTLHQIKESPRDMLHASNHVIDPLLEKWTVWRDARERKHIRETSRYVPSVQNLAEEDEEDRPYHQRYREREGSPRGYYLEGTTTDWRKPNSASARQEASQRRRKYSRYQPSVSAASSDVEDSPGSTGSKKRPSVHHAINSDPESSGSEHEPTQTTRRRRSSGSPTQERRLQFNDGIPLAHTYTAPAQPIPSWITNVPVGTRAPPSVSSGQSIASRFSSPAVHPPGHRPWAAPDQNLSHHSFSNPLPPVHTSNAMNPYAPYGQPAGYPRHLGPPAPIAYGPPPGPSSAQARYVPQGPGRMPIPPRPGSQDGKTRSPSRLSYQSNMSPPESTRYHGERRHPNGRTTKQNLREGATKGLLGAGAIAGFLEALEGLNI